MLEFVKNLLSNFLKTVSILKRNTNMMHLHFLATLPAVQEMLSFSSLARLRLCSKELNTDSSLSNLLRIKKCNVFIPMPARVWQGDRTKFEAQASLNSLLCMLHKTCQVCGCKTRKRNFDPFANMYGHDACVVHAVVHQYFLPETIEANAMIKSLPPDYKLTPYNMKRQKQYFKKLGEWLGKPRNSTLRSRYEAKIYEMSCRRLQFLEHTVKRNLVIQETSIQWGNYGLLDTSAVQNDTVQYIEQMQKKRYAMEMELDLLQVPRSARYGFLSVDTYTFDKQFSARDGAIMLAAKKRGYTYIPQSWLANPRPLRWCWVDYKRKRMRLWRGVARFAGRMALTTHRPQELSPKRRRLE